jgi:ribosomal protein L40E
MIRIDRPNVLRARAPRSSRLRRVTFCARCGTETPYEAMVCHFCGSRRLDHPVFRGRIRR